MNGESFDFETFLYSIDTTRYNFNEYEPFQTDYGYEKLRIISGMPPGQREVLGVRSRGGAKTWEEMVFDLYLAQLRNPYVLLPELLQELPWEAPLRGYWFSTSEDQLDQPKEYFDHIIDNSFLRFIVKRKNSTKVVFKHGGKLKLSILTKKKVRSGRGDYVTFDEEAQADDEFFDAAIGILSQSLFGFISHISTPCKGTKFEDNHDKLKHREYTTKQQLVFKKPWWEIAFLERNRPFYEEEERTKPRWWYLQEYCAEFTVPMGAVFQNVVYDPYPAWLLEAIEDQPNDSGVDWNPAAGHVRGTIKWTPNLENIVVVGEAVFSTGYAREMKMKEFWALAPWFTNGNRIVLEDGGFNIPFIEWFSDMLGETRFNWREQQWNTEEWDPQGKNKMAACNYILQNGITIWVDKIRFKNTAKEIENCSWAKDAKGDPMIEKDPANSPHFFDAFLHAASDKNRDDMRYEVVDW